MEALRTLHGALAARIPHPVPWRLLGRVIMPNRGSGGSPEPEQRRGMTLIELAAVLALVTIASLLFVPSAMNMIAGAKAAAGAREMAMTLHALRWKSVAANRSHGLYFVRDERGWHWFVVHDGNGNGLRTAEVRGGIDPTLSGPHRLEESVDGIHLGFPPAQPLPRIPPRSGSIADPTDPVKFGRSNLVSFSPLGTASSGTLYLTDGRYGLRGVVLFGPTARVRVWRFDTREGLWKL